MCPADASLQQQSDAQRIAAHRHALYTGRLPLLLHWFMHQLHASIAAYTGSWRLFLQLHMRAAVPDLNPTCSCLSFISRFMTVHMPVLQWVRSGKFQLFDYGSNEANENNYDEPRPIDIAAHYGLLEMPIDLVAGSADGEAWLCHFPAVVHSPHRN